MNEFSNMSKVDRLTAFQKKVIQHPALSVAFGTLETVIKNSSGLSLCIVYGPTGVGKTIYQPALGNLTL